MVRRSAVAGGPPGPAAGWSTTPAGCPVSSPERLSQYVDPGSLVGQVEPQHRAAVVGEHRGVTDRLRGDEPAEGERSSGDLEVTQGLRGDLQVDPGRGATLVVLPGGVQEAWGPPEG